MKKDTPSYLCGVRVTVCPPAKAAGHRLDDLIAFLKAGCPLSTARILAEACGNAVDPMHISEKTWEKFKEYTEKLAGEGLYGHEFDAKYHIYDNLCLVDPDDNIIEWSEFEKRIEKGIEPIF